MLQADPILILLAVTAAAAFAAPLGVVPLAIRAETPVRWIGWSNALAAGFMLGAGYVIAESGLGFDPLPAAGGAVLGIAFIYWTHLVAGTKELDLNRLDETEPDYGYKILLVSGLHSASEGIAIGIAMYQSITFGIFVALAMAVHNMPEATVLAAVLRSKNARLSQAAGLSVATNVGQVLLAIVTYSVVSAAPGMLPIALGFAVGALVYLVMFELLPASYHEAGHTSIAVIASVAMGIVILLKDVAP
ncbi:MAG: ZIP family metal transporter [Gemmatimonadota bacterium]